MLRVLVKRLDGQRVEVSGLSPDVTTAELKERIHVHYGIRPAKQRLVLGGHVLEDTDRPLLAKSVADGVPVVHLLPTKPETRSHSKEGLGPSLIEQRRVSSSGGPVVIPRVDFTHVSVFEVIGTGSYKTVYRGSFGTHAIAIMQFRTDDGDPTLAVREATIMARLQSSPHILRFFGLAVDPENRYNLLCEYAPLRSLDGILEDYRTQQQRVNAHSFSNLVHEAAVQISGGMAAVIASGILHRDLSLRNIMCFNFDPVHSRIRVKIGDFGRAVRGPAHTATQQEDIPLRWAAPEVVARRMYSERSEVWSFGVTLWEIASVGALPFASLDDSSISAIILRGNECLLPKPSLCSMTQYALLCQCWRNSPLDRPSFSRLSNELGTHHAVVAQPDSDHENGSDMDKLCAMGFGHDVATRALRDSGGDLRRAVATLVGD